MRSSSNPTTPAGASSGATSLQSSGLNPATRLTPPIVVRGSRSDAIAATTSAPVPPAETSNSRYACDAVPRAKIPLWGVRMRSIVPVRGCEDNPAESSPNPVDAVVCGGRAGELELDEHAGDLGRGHPGSAHELVGGRGQEIEEA